VRPRPRSPKGEHNNPRRNGGEVGKRAWHEVRVTQRSECLVRRGAVQRRQGRGLAPKVWPDRAGKGEQRCAPAYAPMKGAALGAEQQGDELTKSSPCRKRAWEARGEG
jgi:hypothetical protein